MKLFKLENNLLQELKPNVADKEVELQRLVEKNMEKIFSIKFIATEFAFTHGRIDSIAIDEFFNPVIIEYKKGLNNNVITQGLYYINSLSIYKWDFYSAVLNKFGEKIAKKINWNMPKLYCVANQFNKYDVNAIKQIGINIYLYQYVKYGNNYFSFQLLEKNDTSFSKWLSKNESSSAPIQVQVDPNVQKSVVNQEHFKCNPEITGILNELKNYILQLGTNISEIPSNQYIAFKKNNNFACLVPKSNSIDCFLNLNPQWVHDNSIIKDMRNIPAKAPNNYLVTINDRSEINIAKRWIKFSYIYTQ